MIGSTLTSISLIEDNNEDHVAYFETADQPGQDIDTILAEQRRLSSMNNIACQQGMQLSVPFNKPLLI